MIPRVMVCLLVSLDIPSMPIVYFFYSVLPIPTLFFNKLGMIN